MGKLQSHKHIFGISINLYEQCQIYISKYNLLPLNFLKVFLLTILKFPNDY